MKSKSILLIYIYTNCVIYLAVIILLAGGIFQRAQDSFWQDIEVNKLSFAYNITALCLIIITLIITVGLIRLKLWGRLWAMVWNVGIAFLLIGVKIIAYHVLIRYCGTTLKDSNYFDPDTILWFTLGIVLIYLSFFYNKKFIKELFNQEMKP